jgi:hypothetical protein
MSLLFLSFLMRLVLFFCRETGLHEALISGGSIGYTMPVVDLFDSLHSLSV